MSSPIYRALVTGTVAHRAIFFLSGHLGLMRMTSDRLIGLFALAVLPWMLTACATTEPQAATAAARHEDVRGTEQKQLKLQLASGVYRCELGQKVEIQRDAQNANRIKLNWHGNRHTLQRYDSASGLPRYEDRNNGLLWIDLPWKSVLMDANSGRPLANECKAMSS